MGHRFLLLGILALVACQAPAPRPVPSDSPAPSASATSDVDATEISLERQILEATGIARSVSANLQAIAAARVVAIQSDFSHNDAGYAFGQAEVIGWNRGYEEPLAAVVAGWLASPPHADVLLDPYYTQIGCAWATDTVRITTWLVCWFQRADVPAPVVAPPKPPVVKAPTVVVVVPPVIGGTIPDTALPH